MKKICPWEGGKLDHPKIYTVILCIFLGILLTSVIILTMILCLDMSLKESVFVIGGIIILIIMIMAFTNVNNQPLIDEVVFGKEEK